MKRTLTAFSLIALIAVVALPLTALAQPGSESNPTRLLVAFNRAELSLEQLQALQGLVQGTQEAKQVVQSEREALNEFLASYTGSAEEFDAAFEAERQKVHAAVEALIAVKQANAETIGDLLTANQFQALQRALAGVMARGDGGNRGDNQDQDRGRGQGPDGNNRGPDGNRGDQDGPNRDGPNRRGGPNRGGGNLDALLDAINLKIDAIQNQ